MRGEAVIPSYSAQQADVRELGADVVRVMASLMVVVIHVAAPGFYRFDADWFAFNFYDSLSRSAVPLFFMVSGSLLVTRDDSLRLTLKRVLKMSIPLVFGSYVYLLWWSYNDVQPAPDLNPLSLLKGPVVFHFWFFYTLFGVYLFLPVLQGFYRQDRSLHLFYLAMAFLAASAIPALQGFVSLEIGTDLQYFPLYAGYTFAGAVLAEFKPSHRQILAAGVLGIVAGIATAFGTWHLSITHGLPLETLYEYRAPLVVMASGAFYVAFRGTGMNFVRPSASPLVHFAARNSLGIFIFHILLIELFGVLGVTPDFIDPWIGIPLVACAIWCAALAISALIRSLPYGRILLP